MSLLAAIRRCLDNGPATVEQVSEATNFPEAEVRNCLAGMYFREGTVGIDHQNRYHLLSEVRVPNGVPVLRHVSGRDVFA